MVTWPPKADKVAMSKGLSPPSTGLAAWNFQYVTGLSEPKYGMAATNRAPEGAIPSILACC
jgi:hypothetical protein